MRDSSLESFQSEARILLARFLDPALAEAHMDMVRALRPEPDDHARVFTPEVAEAARVATACSGTICHPGRCVLIK